MLLRNFQIKVFDQHFVYIQNLKPDYWYMFNAKFEHSQFTHIFID